MSTPDTLHLSKTETAYLSLLSLILFLSKKNYAAEAESVMEHRWTYIAGIISLPTTIGPLLSFYCGSYVNTLKSPTCT
jgi:hypothetical protein